MPTTEETKVEEKQTLRDVTAAAAQEHTPAEEKPVEEKKEPEVKVEAAKPELDEKTSQAIQLYEALQDPTKAPLIIKLMAEQAGLLKGVETKADIKEAKDEIKDILKSELGDEFEFLTAKLGPAIEKILEKKLTENNADIRKEFETQQAEKIQEQSTRALDKIASDFFGEGEVIPEKVTKQMSAWMDKISPSPDMSPAEYLRFIFNATVGEMGLVKVDKSKTNKLANNRGDVASRLNANSTPVGIAVEAPSKKMTSRQAVELAVKQLQENS